MKFKDTIHDIFHDFEDNCWNTNLLGYELMNAVEAWAEKFPTVTIISCDDDFHMGSILVFIPHEDGKDYWGTTVVFIPQNRDKPSRFFLYPGNAEEMLKVLRKIVKITKGKKAI